MGVPHFYTWLVTRYPLIKSLYNEATLPLIDWFFMDLNGVIYKCAMDDTFAFKDMVKGRRFEEIFMHIFNYVNEIIHLIQPQKMIFLAFDGVAPRAKMNQQRARRFKSARKYQELDDALRAFGIIEKEEHFKNNSISPGTEFMHELSKQMRFFIQKKMQEDDRWRKLKVIFSGVEVPGEGEHKTLEYIRIKTQEPGFDPNTSICIYGPDADLIMLALTTHLPFVCIFREQLKPRARNTSACKRMQKKDSFDFLWINMLREYFEIEFSPLKEKMGARFNVAKIIDDFIFLCFFIGNDFLPRVFCMDIKIGTFDKLIEIFKDTLIENDGYINEKGVICWHRAVNLFKKIAEFELKFINDKLEEQESQQRNINRLKDVIQEIDSMTEEDNRELMAEVEQLKEEYKDFEEIEQLEKEGKGPKEKKLEELIEGAPKKKKNLPTHGSKGNLEEEKAEEEDLVAAGLATVEDAENYLLTHTNEEKISKLLSTQVLEKDIKFMSSLVKIYRTNKSNARLFYYEGKFDVDVEKTPHELTRILTAYMQGLQFVLSYYYTGCPSWMWFYPYYYSPLISDLSNLMTHLNLPHTTDNLITFDYGKAYDPYKQLLLILPIVSLHLLPEPLRSVVSDENSPLYSYYPHEFEVDPFGAVFESEYIAKVPFVDEKLLDSEYAKAIRQVALSGEEIHRNSLGTNYLYEWDQKLPETEVKSALPIYFDNFKVRVKTSTFMLEDFPFDPKKILDGIPPGSQSYHSSYPSLHFIPDKKVEMTEFLKKNVTFYKCCFKVSETAGPGNVQDYRKLLERPFFCMYPFLTPCVILGIITPDQLITNLNYNDLPFPYTKSEHKNYYKDITANVHDTYFNESGVLFDKEDPVFALINCESELRKDSLGNLYCPYPIFDVIPLALIMSSNFKSYYRGDIDLSQKDLPKEFPKFTDVVINMGNNVGSVAKVTGYVRNNFDFDQVEVRIFKLPLNLSNVTKSIAEKYDSHHNYSSAATIANQLGIDVGVLLTVLDFIVIKTEPAVDGKSIYPERFDLGLNLIQRKNHTIVPELIICHELDRQKKSRSFPHFQLSVEAVEIVKEYYRLHKPIFTALARKLETRDTSVLTAEYIYPSSRDPNLELLKVYMWIVKLDIANLVLANKASKVIPREGIQEIETILKKQDHEQADQVRQAASKPLTFNPNYLFPKHPDSWIPPLFYKKPPWHNIGDRVVNLKINGFSFAPFGASGTVVGILGNKPENGTLEVKIEVMFDQPFLGGTNLGGRCTWGKGAVVDFDDIFNINSWYKFIKPRDRRRDSYFQGWDGVISRSYVPTFQTTDDTPEAEEGQTKPFQGPPANKSFAVLTRDLKSIPQQTTAPQDTQYKEYSQADMLKQLQQFQGSLPGANQPQNQPPVQGQQLTQAEMMKQLQQFQGGLTGSTQIQTQPQKPTQSQTQSIQPPSTQGKPVIPKTLGLKQPTQNAPKPSSQAEHHKPAHTTTTSTTFEPKGGSFDFNSFLSSNLAQNTPVQTALQTAKPSTTSAPMSEDQIKGVLNLGTDQSKNKKNLNTGSKTFSVVSRGAEQRNPAPQVVYVEKKSAPAKPQESNPLAAFISSSSGLPISQGKLPETAKAVAVDQVETANKLHEVSQLLGGLNQPPINISPVDVSQVEVKNQFDKVSQMFGNQAQGQGVPLPQNIQPVDVGHVEKEGQVDKNSPAYKLQEMSQLLGTTGQTNPPPQKGFDVSEVEKNSPSFQLHQVSQMLGNQGQGAQLPEDLKPVDVSHIEQGTQSQDAQGQSQPETGTNQESNA